MAITAIKYVFNQSPHRVYGIDRESGQTIPAIQPGEGCTIDMWVPWCWSQQMFNQGKLIEVRVELPGEDIVFAIWQQDREGDYVRWTRFREQPVFDPQAPPIPSSNGGAQAGGDRVLIVRELNVSLEVSGVQPARVADVFSNYEAYLRAGEGHVYK